MHRCFVVLAALVLFGCHFNSSNNRSPQSAPHSEWMAWRAKRHESIAGTNGWLTLTARYWLTEGPQSAGSDPTNRLVLPREKAAAFVGTFFREGRNVRFEAAPGVRASVNDRTIQSIPLISDASNAPTRLRIRSLNFIVIERGDRLGVRVRDPGSLARKQFKGLDCFPYDNHWRLEGRFESFPATQYMRVEDVTGGRQELVSPGTLIFEQGGREHRLQVVEEPDEQDFFVIFRDQSAGKSTYGSGRFLYVARPVPGRDKRVVIDFNRAYTPPCGFTPFATCPLPPRQNWLPFSIEAGERKPH